MIKRLFLPVIFILALFLFSSPAAANISKTPWYSEISGVPYPQEENRVNVESEQLTFDLQEDITNARVSANYKLYNQGSQSINLPAAFALYASPWTDLETVSIEIDGVEKTTRPVWLYDLLWPRVKEWVEGHRDIVSMAGEIKQLKESGKTKPAELLDKTLYERLVSSGIALNVEDRTYETMKDFLAAGEFAGPGNPYESMEIVRLIAPGEVKKAGGAWKSESERTSWPDPLQEGTYNEQFSPGPILGLVLFNIKIQANEKKDVLISYNQTPCRDDVNNIVHYQYLLQPASKWNSFENLNIQVLLPEDMPFASNLPLKHKEGKYSGKFTDLPAENLVLSLKVPEGTFGSDSSSSYTTIIIIFIVFILVCVLALALAIWLIYKFIKKRKKN
ncbi:MAG: hypothetical protein K9L17_09300 [Clostridiales bacterium]|nr:hypothetical protein [Clostridiales bacterium]